MMKNRNINKRNLCRVLAVLLTICFLSSNVFADAGVVITHEIINSVNSFAEKINFTDMLGRAGVLSKNGAPVPRVVSGTYTPSESKPISDYKVDFGTSQPDATYQYNDGTYTGVLSRTRIENEIRTVQVGVESKTITITDRTHDNVCTSYFDAHGKLLYATYSWDNSSSHPTLHIDETQSDGFHYVGDISSTGATHVDGPKAVNADGSYTTVVTYTGHYSGDVTGTKPTYQDLTCYNGYYSGTITKASVDTRVWEYKQNYIGLVYSKELQEQSYGSQGVYDGDPVNVVTGDFYVTDTDMNIPERGMNLQITRYYNSLDTRAGILGKGWRFSYDSSLKADNQAGTAKVIYPDGHTVIFTSIQGTNQYSAPEPIFDILVKKADGTYTLKLQNKLRYNYDNNGRLSSIVDTNDNTITVQYDNGGNLHKVTGAGGKELSFTFQNGMVKTITDPIGRTIQYSYVNGSLSSVKGLGGSTNSYEYENGRIKSITDKNGKKYIENAYDEFGRVVKQYDENRNITRFDYDEANLENTCTFESTGDTTKYKYNEKLYITRKTFADGTNEQYSYDQWGNKNSIMDRNGNKTTYTYNARGNKLSETAPAPISSSISYTYDSNDNLTGVTTSGGAVTSYEYDAKSNLTKATVKLDANTNTVTNYEHDSYGRVTAIRDGESNAITLEYAEGSSPVKATDPEGSAVEYSYDAVGRKAAMKNIYGTTAYEYNVDDKITKITDPTGNTTRFKYDAMGNLVKLIKPEQYNSASDDGTGYAYTYDAMDRMISQADPLGNISGIKYDQQGRKVKDINANYYNPATGNGTGIGYEYDKNGRMTSVINPSGQKSRIVYDPVGNKIRYIDANNYDENSDSGAGYLYNYDQLNRLVEVQDTFGTVVKRLVYDADGRVVKEIDAKGYQYGSTDAGRYGTLYSYNLAGWLMEKRVPEKVESNTVYYQITRYERDKTGKVLKQKTSQEYVTVNGEPSTWNAITYTYYKNGKVKSVQDSLGAQMEYAYDGAGNTIKEQSKINADKTSVTCYHYNAAGLIDKTWKEYDGTDLKDGSTGKVNAETLLEYDKNGNIKKVTRPEGYITTYDYDDAGRLVAKHEEVQADAVQLTNTTANIILPSSNANPGVQYDCKLEIHPDGEVKGINMEVLYDARAYDFAGLTPEISGILIDGGTAGKVKIRSSSTLSIKTATILATLKLKVKEGIAGAGYVTINSTSTYTDADGNSCKFAELTGKSVTIKGPDVNGDGNVEANDLTPVAAKSGKKSGEAGYDATCDLNFDGVINSKDLDYIKNYLFSDSGVTNLAQVKFLEKSYSGACKVSTSKVTRTTTYQYDKAGNLVKETDCNGKSVTYTYDANNQVISVKDKAGAISRIFYDETGNKSKEVTPENYNAQTDNGAGTTYKYDTNNRLLEVRDAQGAVIQRRVYDSAGLLAKLIDAAGYQSAGTDAGRYGTEYSYDAGYRVTAVTSPEARKQSKTSESYTYDAQGFILTQTDGNGHTTAYVRDVWGKVTKVTDAKQVNSLYTYDLAGNLTSSTDGNKRTTYYTYNSLNKLASTTDPSGKVTVYKYDREGRLAQENDRNGQTIAYTYNCDNNLLLKSVIGKVETERFMYGTDGSMVGASNVWGVDQFVYDDNRNLKERLRNGKTYIKYEYNKNNEATKVTDSSGAVTGYTYDPMGRLKTVLDGTSLLATYNYNTDNTLASVGYNTGVSSSYTYDRDKNITGIVQKNSQGGAINNFSYTYDLNGNQLTKTENSAATSYTYDELDRLKTVNYAGRGLETYTYDNAGNRLSKVLGSDNITYTYDANNRLTQSVNNGTTTNYSYDNNGNLLKTTKGSSVTAYTYNGYNQLADVAMPNGNWTSNEYDGLGLRIAETENGTRSEFTLDGQNVIAEKAGDSAETRYIRGLGLVATKGSAGTMAYYLHNAHGDVTNLVDSTGGVKNSYSYDALGNALTCTETVSNRFMYAGEQFDKVTGEYYLRARYYEPVVGRFTQEDTYKGDGLNLYVYCQNNAVNLIDPSGHVAMADDGSGSWETVSPNGKVISGGGKGDSTQNGKCSKGTGTPTPTPQDKSIVDKFFDLLAKLRKFIESPEEEKHTAEYKQALYYKSLSKAIDELKGHENDSNYIEQVAKKSNNIYYSDLIYENVFVNTFEQSAMMIIGDAFFKGSNGKTNTSAANAASFAKYKQVLSAAEGANPLVESLMKNGTLPANCITKAEAEALGWKPGKALSNYAPGKQLGGDIYQNSNNLLPNASGRTWYEADIGVDYSMSRSNPNNPGTRLLYSSDGLLYVSTDHYLTSEGMNFIGKWK